MEQQYTIRPLVISKFNLRKGDMANRLFYGETSWAPDVAWYIEGADCHIIVDTGICASDAGRYTETEVEDLLPFDAALSSIGLKPGDIDLVIQTHLHFDHCANTDKCFNARVIVQKAELDFAYSPHPAFSGFYDKNLIKASRVVPIQGDQEIAPGIQVIFVPGHSPGTQAVSVSTSKGKAIISGFCASRETFYPPTPNLAWQKDRSNPVSAPGIFVDPFLAYDGVVKIKGMADILLPLHDISIFDMHAIP